MDNQGKRKQVEYVSTPPKTLAYVLIGIGAVWLLVSVIGWSLWPLLLLGIGLLMLTGYLRPGDVQTHHFSAPLDGAESAEVHLNLEVGETVIQALDDETALIDADITHLGDVIFTVTGEQHRVVNLKHAESFALRWVNPANWFSHYNDLTWTIGLNPTVPTQLTVSGGAGKADLNLDGMNLTGVQVKGGVGETALSLPATKGAYEVQIQAGVGEFRVHTPETAAVRLEVRTSVGDVKTSSRLSRISDGHITGISGGVWETDSFGRAKHKITIHFNGGVGALTVD